MTTDYQDDEKQALIERKEHRAEIAETLIDIEHAETKEQLEHAIQSPEKITRLMRMIEPISVSLPAENPAIWEYVIQQLNESAVNTARAGLGLLMLKERTPYGSFLNEIEARDIPQRTARNAMAIAKLLLKFPEPRQRSFLTLSGRQLTELTRLPEEVIEEAAEQDVLDGTPLNEIHFLGPIKLREKVRKLIEEQKNNKEAIDRLLSEKEQKIDELTEKLNERDRTDSDDLEQALSADLFNKTNDSLVSIRALERVVIKIMDLPKAPQHLVTACYQAVIRIRSLLLEVQTHNQLADFADDESELDFWDKHTRKNTPENGGAEKG